MKSDQEDQQLLSQQQKCCKSARPSLQNLGGGILLEDKNIESIEDKSVTEVNLENRLQSVTKCEDDTPLKKEENEEEI